MTAAAEVDASSLGSAEDSGKCSLTSEEEDGAVVKPDAAAGETASESGGQELVFIQDTGFNVRIQAPGLETFDIQAVAQAHKHGLSAAIFAAGCVYETQDRNKLVENQCRGCGSATIDTTVAYNGGGCSSLEFDPQKFDSKKVEVEPYFRLFGFDLRLGVLRVTYAMQQYSTDHIECDLAIVLTMRFAEDEIEKIRLGLNVTVAEKQRYVVARDHAYNFSQASSGLGWVTRRYTIWDLGGGAKLEEIGATLESSAANCCLLGEIVVERLTDATGSVTEDGDDGPEIDSEDDDYWEPRVRVMRF